MSDLYKLGQSKEGKIKKVGEEIRLDLELTEDPFLKTGAIIGTITNPQGEPVEGVLIKLMDSEHDPLFHTLTDKTGRYVLNPIPPRSDYHFYAVKDGYLLKEEQGFSIVAGQTLEINATITPDPDAALSTITAHIVDTDGNPIENMTATLLKIEGEVEVPFAVTTTNEYGQAIFVNVPLGDYIARGTKQGYDPASIEVKVTQPGSIININGSITPSPTESKGTINGVITDESGDGIEGAIVILYEVTGDEENPILTPKRYTRTNGDGAYLFGDVPQGDYIVKSNKEA